MPDESDVLLRVIVPGKPVGKAPARTFLQGGRVVTTTPPNVRAWEAKAAALMREAWAGREPLRELVGLHVVSVCVRPKRLSPGKWPERVPHVVRPDGSNVQKCAEDAATKAGVWADDCLVQQWSGSKWYAAPGEEPHVAVTVYRL